MLDWSMAQTDHPVAIKVPGGIPLHDQGLPDEDWGELDRYSMVRPGSGGPGSRVALLGLGTMLPQALAAAALLQEEGVDPWVVNPRYITGLDRGLLDALGDFDVLMTLEDGVVAGGWGQKVAAHLGTRPVKVVCRGLARLFRPAFDVDSELARNGLTPRQVADDVLALLGRR